MRNIFIATWVTVLLVFNAACAANPTPMEVSDGFWKGIREKDAAAVSRYVTAASLGSLENEDPATYILPIKDVTLGRTVIDGEHAWIDTTVEVADERPMHLNLRTILQQENRQWKVDYNATVATITQNSDIGRVLNNIGELSKQFTDKLNQSLDQAQRALPQLQREIGKIEGDLKQRLPELRQRMDDLMRQLEEALRNKPRQESPPPPHTHET